MKASTLRQKIRASTVKSTRRRMMRAICTYRLSTFEWRAEQARPLLCSWLLAGARAPGVGRLQAVERASRRLRFRRTRRDPDHILPRFRRPLQILLAERLDDAEVEQRFRVLRVKFQRGRKLRQRLVRL